MFDRLTLISATVVLASQYLAMLSDSDVKAGRGKEVLKPNMLTISHINYSRLVGDIDDFFASSGWKGQAYRPVITSSYIYIYIVHGVHSAITLL